MDSSAPLSDQDKELLRKLEHERYGDLNDLEHERYNSTRRRRSTTRGELDGVLGHRSADTD